MDKMAILGETVFIYLCSSNINAFSSINYYIFSIFLLHFSMYINIRVYIYLHIGSCFRTTAVGTKPRCKPTSPSGPGLVRTPVELHAPGPSDVFTVWEKMSGVDQIPRKPRWWIPNTIWIIQWWIPIPNTMVDS